MWDILCILFIAFCIVHTIFSFTPYNKKECKDNKGNFDKLLTESNNIIKIKEIKNIK